MASHKDEMRYETQKNQREARGKSVHPRSLARSVAKFINRHESHRENDMSLFKEVVAKLPKTGKSRIYPKVAYKCHKNVT